MDPFFSFLSPPPPPVTYAICTRLPGDDRLVLVSTGHADLEDADREAAALQYSTGRSHFVCRDSQTAVSL